MNIEGYWKEPPIVIEKTLSNGGIFRKEIPSKTDYPIPIPNVLSEGEAIRIYNLIKEVELKCVKHYYMGCSVSRITGETLGNGEYESDASINGWTWPADFAEHYVLQHKVKPTDEFLKFIGYYKTI
jgi:hypothetical protein